MSEQLCQKAKNSYLLTFRDNKGSQFCSKIHDFQTKSLSILQQLKTCFHILQPNFGNKILKADVPRVLGSCSHILNKKWQTRPYLRLFSILQQQKTCFHILQLNYGNKILNVDVLFGSKKILGSTVLWPNIIFGLKKVLWFKNFLE